MLGKLVKNDQFKLVRIVALIAFLIPMFLTKDLWFSNRGFPTVPFFESFTFSNLYFDGILLVAFLGLFVAYVSIPNWKVGIPLVLIYVLWGLLDQNRIQNFFFEIIYVVFALTMFNSNIKLAKQCLLLIFVGTYFYSGLHKYNELFFEKWMHGLNNRIPFIPYSLRLLFTKAIPFLEAGFGLGLLFAKTRKLSIWFLACMHSIIIITLLKDAFGYSVIPLNIFNVFVLFYLFYRDTEANFMNVFKVNHIKKFVFLLLTIILPIFNFFGKYDHILSFSYLSGKPKYARLIFEVNEDVTLLPENIKSNVRKYQESYYLDFNEWAGNTTKVLVYPEERVYKSIKSYVDQYTLVPTRLEYY